MACCNNRNVLVTIQSQTPASDGEGGQTLTWGTFTTLWCSVKQKTAWERDANGQRTMGVYLELTATWYAGILPTMRASFGGKLYNIINANNLETMNRWVVIRVEEGIPS